MLALALATGSSLIELRKGNCFESAQGILEGDTLRVPVQPPSPLQVQAPVLPTAQEIPEAQGCAAPATNITNPTPMSPLRDIAAIRGNAQPPLGGSYRMSVKPGWAQAFEPFYEARKEIRNDILGLLNTEIFGAGLHILRLETLDAEGAPVQGDFCEIPLIFSAP